MKRTLSLAAMLLAFACAFAQATKTFEMGEIKSLINNECLEIKCVHSPDKAGTLEVTATDQALELLKVDCKNQTMTISIKHNNIPNLSKQFYGAVLYYSDALANIEINGSGNAEIPSLNTTSAANLTVNGSGGIEISRATAAKISAVVNGSGEIEIKSADSKAIIAQVNGSGDLEIDSAKADDINAWVNGSGDLELKNISAYTVAASMFGSGDLMLSGTANRATYRSNGSGDLQAHRLIAKSVTATASGSGYITYNRGADTHLSGRKDNIKAK